MFSQTVSRAKNRIFPYQSGFKQCCAWTDRARHNRKKVTHPWIPTRIDNFCNHWCQKRGTT